MANGGKMVVVFADEEHLGSDVGLDLTELGSVIYQEISTVSPRYRDYRLQRIMAEVLMEQLKVADYQYVCATVAPFNIASLKDKFSQWMEIAALKNKYGGVLRSDFVKHLHKEGDEWEVEQFIPTQDTIAQQKRFEEGSPEWLACSVL